MCQVQKTLNATTRNQCNLKIYKLSKLSKKTSQCKMSKSLYRHFMKDGLWIANKHTQ